MAIDNDSPPRASAPPISPILAAVSGTGEHNQKSLALTSAPIPISKSSSTTHNNVMDMESMFPKEMPFQTMVSAAQNRSSGTPLHGHYRISSCSAKSYIPTPYNSPGCSPEKARPKSNTINADGKPTTSSPLYTEKVRLRGGGAKRRRGGAVGSARKRGKADMYDDVDTLLSDIKSPIFKEHANIKGVLLHPRTKETITGEGEIYPFEYMTSEELATTAAAFKEDGAYGRYDVDWLRQALEASSLRTAGVFDEHEAKQFVEDWAEEDEEISDEEVEKDSNEMEEDDALSVPTERPPQSQPTL